MGLVIRIGVRRIDVWKKKNHRNFGGSRLRAGFVVFREESENVISDVVEK